jgi:SAM-dependent methyltransferase
MTVGLQLIAKLYKDAEVYPNKLKLLEAYFKSRPDASVLDVGFYGQGFRPDLTDWPHNYIRSRVRRCVGIDIASEVENLRSGDLTIYRMSAEDFRLDEKFDVIYAGDIIEHLSNPGNFLNCSLDHLSRYGEIVVTTPNPYFLTSILQKLTYRFEPSINPEHTCFFNVPSFAELASRHSLKIERLALIKRLGTPNKPGFLMQFAHALHHIVFLFTKKFAETFVFILVRDSQNS